MPELRDCHCLKEGFNGFVGITCHELTKVSLDYDRIVEIDHAGGQLMENEDVGRITSENGHCINIYTL
jgi:hypothetical protein